MTVGRRLSLLVRTGLGVGILTAVTLSVPLVAVVAGEWLLWTPIRATLETLASLPAISDMLPVPSALVAMGAAAGALALAYGWSARARYVPVQWLAPPTPLPILALVAMLGCLSVVLVDGSTALLAALETTSRIEGLVLAFGSLALFLVVLLLTVSRRAVRRLRASIIDDSSHASTADRSLEATVARLAQRTDIPVPDVYVTKTDRPESFTLGAGESAIIVVSNGLLETLSDDELEAVMAHECSHL